MPHFSWGIVKRRTLAAAPVACKHPTPRGDITIRALEPADAEGLVAFQQHLFAGADHLVRRSADYRTGPAQERANIRKRRRGGLSLGAFHDDQQIGLLAATAEALPRRAHCAGFFIGVLPAWQGHAIGRVLMQQLLIWAEANPAIERLELHVHASNRPAIALYRRFGFVEEGRRRRAIKYGLDHYVDDVLMAREVIHRQ